jgi:hypothetical protein
MSGSLRLLPEDAPPTAHEHVDLELERLRGSEHAQGVEIGAGDVARQPLGGSHCSR